MKVVHESHVNAIVYDVKSGRLYSGDGGGTIVVWRRGVGGRGVEDYSVLRKVTSCTTLSSYLLLSG